MWWSENSVSQSGALTPLAASTALGAIVAARGLPLPPIVDCLEINQGHWTRDAVKDFAGRPLAHALGLPHAAAAKASIRLEELLAPGRDGAIHVESEPEPGPLVGDNHGRPVFRLKQDQLGVGAFAGLFVGGAGGVGVAALTAGSNALVAALAGAGVVVGAAIGRRLRRAICADPSCGAVIPRGTKTCPGCDGIVAGDIRHRNDRLDAADRWVERQAITARAGESRGPR